MKQACLIFSLVMMATSIMGCVSESNQPPRPEPIRVDPGSRVDFVELYSDPAPVNWNDDPAADGVRIRLFFYQTPGPRTTIIRNGKVQVMIYEGGATELEIRRNVVRPFKIWEFNAAQVAQFQARVAVGTVYAMQLGWEEDKPRSNTITIVARYVAPDGKMVYAKELNLYMLAN